ncbi:hypothetical protein SNEBB_008414 [Seison nebaliae]|nr:hypothetical protein SNEBB_008414 [Seison nebaliae]
MEEKKREVDRRIGTLVEVLDKKYLRSLQGATYRCNAKCCEDVNCSSEAFQRCIERCSQPMQAAENTLNQGIQSLQNRLQQCATTCIDEASDMISSTASQNAMTAKQKHVESCMEKCMNDILQQIPKRQERLSSDLQRLFDNISLNQNKNNY